MNISCIVVDDEPLAVQLLETYVRKTPFLDLNGSFSNGKEAFTFLQENDVDLLFCDIQMPNLSGMELSKMLPERTKIIFTTAFSSYAIDGYKVHALDYLLKPISYEDFLTAAKHAKEVIEAQKASAAAPKAEASSIFVKSEYKLQKIDFSSIIFIEGLKDYVKIYLSDASEPVLTLMRMKTLEEQLPASSFVRVHRSYIVNIKKIDAIERGRILMGQYRIPISDSYEQGLYSALAGSSLFPNDK
jgi:DNA-binding LytR/AlgR family response regulator